MNTIVIYRSRTGFVKKYAEWIAEELSADLNEGSDVCIEDLKNYHTIIYGGGCYATGINGVKLITDNFEEIKGKKLVVFASGASPGRKEDIDNLKKANFTNEQLEKIKFFYLRGGFNFKKLRFPFTLIMRIMKWHLKLKKNLTSDEKGMLQAFKKPADFTSKDNIRELVEYCRK